MGQADAGGSGAAIKRRERLRDNRQNKLRSTLRAFSDFVDVPKTRTEILVV